MFACIRCILGKSVEPAKLKNMKSIYLGLGYSVLLDIVYSDFGLFMVKESILVLITDCDKEYFSPNKQTENLYYFLLKNENIKL